MTLPSLYTHQEEHLDKIRTAIARDRAVIACAPPGAGKTRLAKWMLGSYASKEKTDRQSGYAVFAVHRRGLVDNATFSFMESPALTHGVIMSGRECYGGRSVQVASIDTLLSWFCEGGAYASEQTYDLIVFDECHSHHTKLVAFLNAHNVKRTEKGLDPPFVLGLSATPEAKGLGDLYMQIVKGPTTEWLIESGFLSPFRYFRATEGDLGKLVKRGDEFTVDSFRKRSRTCQGAFTEIGSNLADGRATVGFFPRLTHGREAMEELSSHGLRVAYVDGTTKDDERRQIFADLNNGHIDYLCNVGVVERGTDIPRVACVQVCTAVGSIARWRQMIGRGSRKHPAKTDCIVLDHGGNIQRGLGFFEDDVEWSLDWTSRSAKTHEARSTMECPKCSAVYRGGKCMNCGYEPTRKERKSQGLAFDGSKLKEIKPRTGKTREKSMQSCEQILVSSLFTAGKTGKTFRQALALAYRTAEKQGTQFRVPRNFTIAGRTFQPIPRGHRDQNRKISETYPFTVGAWRQGDNQYMVRHEATA